MRLPARLRGCVLSRDPRLFRGSEQGPERPRLDAQDSLAAAAIVSTLLRRPEAIDSLTAGSLTRDHALGFGRRLREAWVNPAGKLGFAFKIYYEGARPSASKRNR